MANPTLGDIHFDQALTDFSVAYFQNDSNYVATQVFPLANVAQKSNKYHVYDKAASFRSDAEKRSPGTESNTRLYTMSTGTYDCDVVSVAINVSEQQAANADSGVDPERDAAEQTVQDIRIRMESDWASAAFSTGVWGTESTASWSLSTGDPVGDLATAKRTVLQNTGFEPNTLVLGANAWYNGLWQNSAIRGLLADNQPQIITPQMVGQHFGFDRVLIAKAVQNTATQNSTADPAMGFIGGSHALVCYVDPNPGLRKPTAGRTFSWSGLLGNGGGVRTKRYDVPKEDAYPRVETDAAYDFKVTGSDLGFLIKYTNT